MASSSNSSEQASAAQAPSSAELAGLLDNPDYQRCNALLENQLFKNPRIVTILDKLTELGCPIPQGFFKCRPCDGSIAGGLALSKDATTGSLIPQIILCQNKGLSPDLFHDTLVHELVHAYDVCTAKFDFNDCVAHACSEVRASALSGECDLLKEMRRGNFVIPNSHKDCVRRRATLSVSHNPACAKRAEEAVSIAFRKCYGDSAPFEDTK